MTGFLKLVDGSFDHVRNAGRETSEQAAEDLNHGGGGGTSGGMESRIARLESDMEHSKRTLDRLDAGMGTIRTDVGAIKVSLAKLETRVDHLPSKGFIFVTAASMVGAVSAITALIVRLLPAAG